MSAVQEMPTQEPLSRLGQLVRSVSTSWGSSEIQGWKKEAEALVDELMSNGIRCAHCGTPLSAAGDAIVTAPHHKLSRREREVLGFILDGRRLKEIAATLDISVKTVTTHRSRLMRKLQVEDNLSLYRYGIVHGLIPL